MCRFFIFIFFLCFVGQKSFAMEKVQIHQGISEIRVFPFQYRVDKKDHFDINSIHGKDTPWTDAELPDLNFGFTDANYWMRFVITNNTKSYRNIFLEISYPLHDQLNLYLPDREGNYSLITTGDGFPFGQRPIRSTRFLFELDLLQIGDHPV